MWEHLPAETLFFGTIEDTYRIRVDLGGAGGLDAETITIGELRAILRARRAARLADPS
jgi:hypothetical protein